MEQAKCPIKGCNMSFAKGILGWHTHVAKVDAHPYWHPEELNATARKILFVKEFQDWFVLSVGHATPASIRVTPPHGIAIPTLEERVTALEKALSPSALPAGHRPHANQQ